MRELDDEIEGVEGVGGIKGVVESTKMRNKRVAVLVEGDIFIDRDGYVFLMEGGEMNLYANGTLDGLFELKEIDTLGMTQAVALGGTVYNMEDI